MRIVHFGAGNIGRGAIPEIFNNLYHQITFIDPFPEIVDKLNNIKTYTIKNINNVKVKNYNAYLISDVDKVLEALNQADIITTACGFDNLANVAVLLNQIKTDKKIHVVCFENNIRPTTHLKSFLNEPSNFILLDCTIDRVVPKQSISNTTLDLITEDYLKVVIEKNNSMNMEYFGNCEIVNDLTNYISLKLFAVNGLHFLLAILTYNHGFKYIHEYMNNKKVISLINEYSQLLVEFLSNTYQFKIEYVQEFVKHNLSRFSNALLNDECVRVARNAKLKLKEDNRIIPVLKYFLLKNIKTETINEILLELFNYKNLDDSDSQEIQEYLNEHDLNETISHYSNLKTNIVSKG